MNAVFAGSLGYTGRRYKSRNGARHDVGDGRLLTAREIALLTGCNVSAIYGRIENGDTGASLLRPLRCKRYDCGGESLTVKQIMQRTGLGETAVRSRISRGMKGAELLRHGRRDMAVPRSPSMVVACRLAAAFPSRLPTTKEIRAVQPMSAGAAERWLAALRAARDRA